MSVKGLPSKGTIFAIGAGDAETVLYNAETFTTVGRTTGIPGAERSRNMIDVTDLSDEWQSDLPGIKRGGSFPVAANRVFGDAGQQAMVAAWESGTLKWFEITYADGTVGYGQCYVESIGGGEATVDDKVAGTFTVKPQNYAEIVAA